MAMSGELKVIGPNEGRAIHWLGSRATFFATSAETASAFAIWTDEPPPGGGPVPHAHTREEEFFYVLEGNVTFWCAGEEFAATPGAFVGLPKGLGHQFRNEGKGPSRILIFFVPGGCEGFFLELGNPFSEPHDATIPPDPKRIEALSARYGQKIAEPSLLHPVPDPSSVNLPLGVGRAPILRPPGEGEVLTTGGILLTLKAVGPQTLGTYSLTEFELPAGATFPAHRHARFAEGLYVLEGEISVRADGPPLAARAGSVVVVPPSARHTLANTTGRTARVLSLTTPAGIEDFYRSACRPVHDRPAQPSADPSDGTRLSELGPQFGVQFA
jgi:quercetin dioxygenase-like cupin family protein